MKRHRYYGRDYSASVQQMARDAHCSTRLVRYVLEAYALTGDPFAIGTLVSSRQFAELKRLGRAAWIRFIGPEYSAKDVLNAARTMPGQ